MPKKLRHYARAALRPLKFSNLVVLCMVPVAWMATACTPMDEMPATTPVGASQPVDAAQSGAQSDPASDNDQAGDDQAIANTLKWQTASEIDNFGFDVYRSLSPDGPFETINSDVIPGAGTIDEPQRYEYRDEAIDEDTTYYYYVESIDSSGGREHFTPIIKAGPKSKSE